MQQRLLEVGCALLIANENATEDQDVHYQIDQSADFGRFQGVDD